MSWYRDNRWLGNFVIAFAGSALLALWFLFHVRSGFAEAFVQFNDAAAERNRLEHLNPFPNEENYRKTQTALDNYGASLNKLKDELRAQTVPLSPLAPNEFQSRLRRAIVSTTEKARANFRQIFISASTNSEPRCQRLPPRHCSGRNWRKLNCSSAF